MKTILPDPGDLYCDTCPNRYADRGHPSLTIDSARAYGWHIYIGPGMGGHTISSYLCPDCVGGTRPPRQKIDVMEGQADILGDLNVTLTIIPKVNRGKGRENP